MYSIYFKELFLVAVPGVNRIVPFLMIPILFDGSFTANVYSYIALYSVLVLVTLVGMSNSALSLKKDAMGSRLKSVYYHSLVWVILLQAVLLYFYGVVIEMILACIWYLLWGGYQQYRLYLIALDRKNELLVFEAYSIVILIFNIILSLTNVMFFKYTILFLHLVLINLYMLKEYLKVRVERGGSFVVSAMGFSAATASTSTPFLLMPYIFSLLDADEWEVILAGLISNIGAVAVLLSRALSNYYLPKMIGCSKKELFSHYKKFRVSNFILLTLYVPVVIASSHVLIYLLYPFLLELDSSFTVLVLFFIAMFFSQCSLPESNLFTVKGEWQRIMSLGVLSLLVFSVSICALYFFDKLSLLLLLVILIVVNMLRWITSLYWANKKYD